MRKAQSLMGLNVISHADGTLLGRVRDLIFDHESSELLAVVLSEKDLFGLIQAQVVPWREVVSIGRDAIIVQSAASKIKAGDDERLGEVAQRQTSLGGTRIFTTDGVALGTLGDVFIDEASGHVAGYEISGGFISDTLRGKRFLPALENVKVGKDVAFVPPEAAQQMAPRAWQEGSWQHGTVSVGDRFSSLAGTAREKAEALYNSVATTSADKQEAWVIGRVAGREVTLPGGGEISAVLVHSGEVITAEIAHKARLNNALSGLVASAIEGAANSIYTAGKEKLSGPSSEDDTSSSPTSSPSGPLETVQAKAAAAAIGKTSGRTVLREDGSTLLAPGEMITDQVMADARVQGKENEVIAAAGLGAAQAGLENAREQANSLWENLKTKAEEWGGAAQNKRDEAAEAALHKRMAEVAGRRSLRLILDRSDHVIVNEGDIITYAAMTHAREHGVLEVLLDSASTAPPAESPVGTVAQAVAAPVVVPTETRQETAEDAQEKREEVAEPVGAPASNLP